MSNIIYKKALFEFGRVLDKEQIKTDTMSCLAWGTDAGFYRLIPQIVLFPKDEAQVASLLSTTSRLQIPVTFRAAGTSLSGQSITDSVLIVVGKGWEDYTLSPEGSSIRLQPGIIGERVNQILAPFGRKFSPDPASVRAAMVGGILMNNASGMNCGTHANSDKILMAARMIWPDGTLLDTSSEASKKAFSESHPHVINSIIALRDEVLSDTALKERIAHKYRIKNVMGLSLLPLITYQDPFDIIAHLLIGSEGTLAFLAEATLKTQLVPPYKASALVFFKNIDNACRAIVALKHLPVIGAELLDRVSLRAIENRQGMPSFLKDLSPSVTAVLFETAAQSQQILESQMQLLTDKLSSYEVEFPVQFTDKKQEYSLYWDMRSGIFPSVGALRDAGSTSLIEDVAFPLDRLAEATADLQAVIAKHGYTQGAIYGHALEGNYHCIINQRFDSQQEIGRYQALINDLITLVVDKYDGSLKAEHGTGRNMAPFVQREWGERAFGIMRRIKEIFDPHYLLNPGVIFNDDPDCHLHHFKPLPIVNSHIDGCIECGFCEVNCLTCGFTLSSRQRIVIQREIARLMQTNEDPDRGRELAKLYRYSGEQTCAADGLCSTSCPMGINVGDYTHILRGRTLPPSSLGYKVGDYVANHFLGTTRAMRSILLVADTAHTILGSDIMSVLAKGIRVCSGGTILLWSPAMPRSFRIKPANTVSHKPLKVVYFPSCINQTMGVGKQDPDQTPLVNKMQALLQKAGYEVIFPQSMGSLCCGTIWESKGVEAIADRKSKELEQALWKASEAGKYPILCDQSPCLYRMRHTIKQLKLYEPVEFIETFLIDKLEFTPIDMAIAIHPTCSMRKMGLSDLLLRLARRCVSSVLEPQEVGCCGFAGDKGFTLPEVNRYALRKLRPQIEKASIERGYSNSRTCEIGLTTHSGVSYQSIVYLVDMVTRAKS